MPSFLKIRLTCPWGGLGRSTIRIGLAFWLGAIAVCLGTAPLQAAGVVTDCADQGPGPGTLLDALQDGGLVVFSCSGSILITEQIPINQDTILDGTGQRVTLLGDGDNRIFNVGSIDDQTILRFEIRHLTLTGGNAGSEGGGAITTYGGSSFSYSAVTITHSSLLSNTAFYGGAIDQRGNYLTIINSTLAGNVATGGGTDGGGGAIDQFGDLDPDTFIVNSTIAHNRAPAAPGRDGIWLESGRLRIRNSLVAYNSATKSGGLQSANCTIETNQPGGANPQFVPEGANMATDSTCGAIEVGDPLLATLGDNGGPTATYALRAASPAIDRVGVGQCTVAADQRRSARPLDGDHDGFLLCDLGAFEYADRFYVNAAASDGLAGYWKLDENSGTIASDASGNAHYGTVQGAATFTPAHAPVGFANAAALAAAGGFLEVPDADALDPVDGFTLAAWVRLQPGVGNTISLAKTVALAGPGYALTVAPQLIQGELWNGTGTRYVVTGTVAASGAWLHVALRWEANRSLTLYVNGMPVAGVAASGLLQATAAPLRARGTGQVDDLRLYAAPLSDGQINLLAGGRSCITGGTAWLDAAPDLQCALAEARAGDEVWVAQGRYFPTRGADRTAAFEVGNGVGLYGGFLGEETERSARNPFAVLTELSGDIDGNDVASAGAAAIAGANAHHVVVISGTTAAAVVDGFTVSGGQADGAQLGVCGAACGGGVYIAGSVAQLANLAVTGNRAAGGGGIFAANSTLVVLNSTVRGNQAGNGGGVYAGNSSTTLIDLLASGNRATVDGGGVYVAGSSARMVNLSAAGNQADGRGGGLFVATPQFDMANSILIGNSAGSGGQIFDGGATMRIHRSLLSDGCPPGATCTELLSGDPLFVQAPLPADAPTSAGDLRLEPTSTLIDAGDNSASLGGAVSGAATIADLPTDVAGNPRLAAVYTDARIVDLGAYEMPNTPPLFTSTPVTVGYVGNYYIYWVHSIDPNDPDGPAPTVTGQVLPSWASLGQQPGGLVSLTGTPASVSGATPYAVTLVATDARGATTQQAYAIAVTIYDGRLYLPKLMR